jgi:CHASE3 domain sensor protein
MRSMGRPLAVRVINCSGIRRIQGSTMADGILKNMYGMNEEEKHIKAKQLKEQLGYFLFKVQTHGGRGTS